MLHKSLGLNGRAVMCLRMLANELSWVCWRLEASFVHLTSKWARTRSETEAKWKTLNQLSFLIAFIYVVRIPVSVSALRPWANFWFEKLLKKRSRMSFWTSKIFHLGLRSSETSLIIFIVSKIWAELRNNENKLRNFLWLQLRRLSESETKTETKTFSPRFIHC